MTDGVFFDVCSFLFSVWTVCVFFSLYFDIGKPHQSFFHIVEDVMHIKWVHMVWNWLFVSVGCSTKKHIWNKCCSWNMMFFFMRLSFKNIFFVIGFEQKKTSNLLWRDHFLRSEYIFNEKVIFFWKFEKKNTVKLKKKDGKVLKWHVWTRKIQKWLCLNFN